MALHMCKRLGEGLGSVTGMGSSMLHGRSRQPMRDFVLS